MIVLDASAMIELLALTRKGRSVQAWLRQGEPPHAPYLMDVEVAHLVRKQNRLGILSEARAVGFLEDLRDLRITRHPHHLFLDRIWELRTNFTAYDACYLALAEHLEATLLTCDAALGGARLARGAVCVI